MRHRHRLTKVLGVAATVGAVLLTTADPAAATVSTTPSSSTPYITSADTMVRQLAQCGATMYAVGTFTAERSHSKAYSHKYAFSFNASTGVMTSWNPVVNGLVNSVGFNSSCTTVYLGGQFTSVDGAVVKNLAAVNATTGAFVSSFKHSAGGQVETVLAVDGGAQLMVGGKFTAINGSYQKYYASLNPGTGAVTGYLSAVVAGQLPPNAGPTNVYNQQLSPKGDRLLFEGNFLTIGGQAREQMAELDLSGSAATLDPWTNSVLNTSHCDAQRQFYGQAGAFSPDESTLYMATTGGADGASPFCDAVVAFANTAAGTVKWTNKTGGDSLFAVAAGAAGVYVGGHERWLNNPKGHNSCGAGCVSRPGVSEVSASTGLATTWNPTRDRGQGADDMLVTSAGLWVASDTYDGSALCAGQYHPGICFFPGAA